MNPRDKRDLPEVVAEILIEQHAMREDIAAMRQDIGAMRGDITALRQDLQQSSAELRQDLQLSNAELREELKQSSVELRREMRAGNEEMVAVFNNMTNAILDAINRGTDRYNGTTEEIDSLKRRVTRLENPTNPAA